VSFLNSISCSSYSTGTQAHGGESAVDGCSAFQGCHMRTVTHSGPRPPRASNSRGDLLLA